MGTQLPQRGTTPQIFGPCLLWPNGWMDQDATWYGGRPRPRRHCARWRPSFPQGARPPIFGPCLLWPNGRPCQLLLSSCWLGLIGALQIGFVFVFLWPPYGIGQAIIFSTLWFLLPFFFSSPNLRGCRLDVYHTSTHGVASVNLECRSEMWCTRLAENAGRKKSPKNRHLGTITQLCRAISWQLRHLSTMGKIVKQQYPLHMSSQYGELGPPAAEIIKFR